MPPGVPYIRFRFFHLAAPPESSGASDPPNAPRSPVIGRIGPESGAGASGADGNEAGVGRAAVGGAGSVGGGRLTPAAFSALYQEHHRALWCIAAAIVRDRELAYDVVQEAAVIALGKLTDFDPTTSFPAWCGQIVRFVALNQRKRTVRSKAHATDPTVMAANAPAAAAVGSLDRVFSARLVEALELLDETARACLLMKTVMDLSYKHIAEALAIPEGTAMSHVHRSRQVLRKHLETDGKGGEQ